MKAHLSVEQAHEYIRTRLKKLLIAQELSLNDAFRLIDRENKGYITHFDL